MTLINLNHICVKGPYYKTWALLECPGICYPCNLNFKWIIVRIVLVLYLKLNHSIRRTRAANLNIIYTAQLRGWIRYWNLMLGVGQSDKATWRNRVLYIKRYGVFHISIKCDIATTDDKYIAQQTIFWYWCCTIIYICIYSINKVLSCYTPIA